MSGPASTQARKSNAAEAIKSSSRHSAQFRSINLQDRQRQSETPESSESVRCWSKGDRCLEARTRREATGLMKLPSSRCWTPSPTHRVRVSGVITGQNRPHEEVSSRVTHRSTVMARRPLHTGTWRPLGGQLAGTTTHDSRLSRLTTR